MGQLLPFIDQQINDEAHTEGKDGEVVLFQAQRHHPCQDAQQGAGNTRCHKGPPERPTMIHGENRQGIGADGKEAAMGEIQLATKPGDDIHAVDRNGPDKCQCHHVDLVFIARHEGEQQCRQDHHDLHRRRHEKIGNLVQGVH